MVYKNQHRRLIFEANRSKMVLIGHTQLEEVKQTKNDGKKTSHMCGLKQKLPLMYLGLLLGAKYKSKDIWNLMIKKFEKRLAAWKGLYLSKGSKFTLLKSVLSNLPVNFLSLFSPPKTLIDQRNFLWDSFEGDKNCICWGGPRFANWSIKGVWAFT